MSQGKVMLVDDEENVLSSLNRCLRHEGYEMVMFPGTAEALQYLSEESVDVIVSDHRMPGMTGIEFLIKARKLYPDAVRVLLTGYADMDVAIKAVNEGKLFRFLTKPWKDEELKITIKNALDMKGLLDRNRELLGQVRKQESYIKVLKTEHPGIDQVRRDSSGAILIDDKDI